MDYSTLLEFMSLLEKLKCNLRHSWTSTNRQESVAEHSWRLAVLSWLLKDKFADYDMNKVLLMCLFHDIGEAVTGDIPTFLKTDKHEEVESCAIDDIIAGLPDHMKKELSALFQEMKAMETKEAKLFKALDKMEAVIQHNEAALDTWLPLEYELQLTYGDPEVAGNEELMRLRNEIREITNKKIREMKDEG